MFNDLTLIAFFAAFLLAIAVAVLLWHVRRLTAVALEAERRHRTYLAEAEQGGAVRRKIESQLIDNQQRLGRLANHDPLTDLPNRAYLAKHLPQAIAAAKRNGTSLAVLFLDLDRFKHINDTRGHETGDKLLRAVAQRLREAVRGDDVVVRMGGDEFLVVMSAIKSATQVNETAARITAALAQSIDVDGRPLVATVSIGVSLFPRDGETVDALMRHADSAMYQAKERGRNNFQVFSPVMDRKLKERVAIEQSLRAALSAGELDVHYQPVVDVDTRRVVALEALLRWEKGAALSPAQFIPVAEDTGLIVPIGEFVLDRVIGDLVAWRGAGGTLVPVALNVSASQLRRQDLRAAIGSAMQAHNLKPGLLQIELTEGAMFEQLEGRHGESNESAVNDLRAAGVRIAIDDFGTGYSSLAYLKRWRVDYLKVDRSFVRDLATDPSDLAIVGAIVAMARHMRIEVIAEGVEGWPQLETLRKLGCRYAQGYLFAEPSPASACLKFLQARPLSFANLEAGDDLLADATHQVA
jgi:diguanylate cyclase (GGDEF)-like protein